MISDVLLLSEMDRKDCSALSTFISVLGWGNDTGDGWLWILTPVWMEFVLTFKDFRGFIPLRDSGWVFLLVFLHPVCEDVRNMCFIFLCCFFYTTHTQHYESVCTLILFVLNPNRQIAVWVVSRCCHNSPSEPSDDCAESQLDADQHVSLEITDRSTQL